MSGFSRGLVQAAACGTLALAAGTAGTWWPLFVANAPQILGGGSVFVGVIGKMVYEAIRERDA